MNHQHRFRERSTWSSRKFRESNIFIREEWPFPDKGILINNLIHITSDLIYIYIIPYGWDPAGVKPGYRPMTTGPSKPNAKLCGAFEQMADPWDTIPEKNRNALPLCGS